MSLRVLILTHHFSALTETFIYHDAVALQRHAGVRIGCFYRENEFSRPFEPVTVLPYELSWWRRKWQNLLYRFNIRLHFHHAPLKRALKHLLRDFQPDVLHLHFGIQALHFLDNLEFSGPIFITFHGYDATKIVKKSAIYRKRLAALFHQKNVFPLATSASLFQFMAGYQLTSKRSRVLYSGIDLALFTPSTVRQKSKRIVFTQISSFRAKKGHRFLLPAFKALAERHPEKDLRLILAGGGPLQTEIEAQAAELKLEHKIEFIGWIDQRAAAALLDQTDVFVHPSITDEEGDMESTSVSILEAMAMELPIFATYHSGIPEIVEHGFNGLLAAEKDLEAYTNCMETLMDWGPQPQNRQKIVADFSHEAHIRTLLQAYEQAIKSLS